MHSMYSKLAAKDNNRAYVMGWRKGRRLQTKSVLTGAVHYTHSSGAE